MIPKVDLANVGFGKIELRVGKEIPTELAAWVRIKTNEKFYGQPAGREIEDHIRATINADLYRLVEQRYILYIELKDIWVVTRPLFKWVKYDES
jgi:hypothetical protein